MSKIPADVMVAAREAILAATVPDSDGATKALNFAVSEAILAERARCKKLVTDFIASIDVDLRRQLDRTIDLSGLPDQLTQPDGGRH